MKINRHTRADSSIPTSSMADIAFLLIIFFMVTTVFSATRGLELNMPEEKTDNQGRDDHGVLINVLSDRVLVDCKEMGVDEILSYLAPKLAANPSKPVILYTDSEADFQDMVSVYDVLGERVDNIFIPTKSDIDSYVGTFGQNPFEEHCK